MDIRRLSPRVRCLVAPNASPWTDGGTNTYLVGRDRITVIDPGPADPGHIDRIIGALGGATLARIILTHGHADHASGAAPLARRTGVAVLAHPFGLHHREVLGGGGVTLEALYAPGHAGDHFCFLLREEDALFSGDLIMAGSTVVVAPPEGDMTAYLRSLETLRAARLARIYPGHGGPIDDPARVIDDYLSHRRMREHQILDALRTGPARIDDLVPRIYAEVPQVLHPLAAQSVFAHLLKLRAEGKVSGTDRDADWKLT